MTQSPTQSATSQMPETDIPEAEINALVDRMGGLADRETARRMLELEAEEDEHAEEAEMCELCGDAEATTFGVACVNNRAYPNSELCDDCFIPFEDIILPQDVDRETMQRMHTDRPINA